MGTQDGRLFPGKKYEVKRAKVRLTPKLLEKQIEILSREIGPDHPRVKALRKQIQDMDRASSQPGSK